MFYKYILSITCFVLAHFERNKTLNKHEQTCSKDGKDGKIGKDRIINGDILGFLGLIKFITEVEGLRKFTKS